ncbi:hypothetical protein HJC23_006136 [Cyclotella cryptica]|uniref:RING-type domain-containing protein n=1 Tax=Cyclotella cryptica TaxID=29204 RepID=A0ABD3QKI7_9STRA|eukprot:CCRYP_004625-RA/>CCRYP_004625-RA protein AED:0.00 eAED:0.00 QI:238/-1/1/1/-1/1/1/105/459
MSEQDCPICLNPMAKPDLAHPVPCPCSFNFCVTCLSSLLASSKDDYQMASDGNRHVKVHLNCPNCRHDISRVIEGTIEERRIANAKLLKDVPDCELSSGELQQKYWTKGDELILQSEKNKKQTNMMQPALEIDTTLFGGLEFAMTEQEQKYVTKLMTSGYADQLCQAAQILEGTAELVRKGISPSLSKKQNDGSIPPSINREAAATARTTSMLAGGYSNTAGIGPSRSRDGNDVTTNFQRQMAQKARDKIRRPLPARMPLSVTLSTGEFEKLALATRQQAGLVPDAENKSWWRGIFGDAGERLKGGTLTFVDDEWDGSIADAFARARIGPQKGHRKAEVHKKLVTSNPAEKMSIDRILKVGEEEVQNIDAQQQPREDMPVVRSQRVLVAGVRGQAGKSGIMKGDVVTHVNGEPFTGNADDLNSLLVSAYEEQGRDGVVMIVVNADECTAEALRLRSRIR